jgi:hypothetical protein
MKKALIVLAFLCLVLTVNTLGAAHAITIHTDRDDETSTPNGYAEAIVQGNWIVMTQYGSIQYIGINHCNPNLVTTEHIWGYGAYGVLIYNITFQWTGQSYTYNLPASYIRQGVVDAWIQVTTGVPPETATATIGPPGSQ